MARVIAARRIRSPGSCRQCSARTGTDDVGRPDAEARLGRRSRAVPVVPPPVDADCSRCPGRARAWRVRAACAPTRLARGDAAAGILRDRVRVGSLESHGDAVRARRPSVRVPAGRGAAGDQERHAAGGAVRRPDGGRRRRARPARRGLRSQLRGPTSTSTSTTRPPTTPRRNRISRFTANGDVAVAGSEFVVMDLDTLSDASNHNGGAIALRPRRQALRGGGRQRHARRTRSRCRNRHGKMLRINADGTHPGRQPVRYGTAARRSAPIAPSGRWAAQPVHLRLQSRRPGPDDAHQRRRRRRRGRRSTTASPEPTTAGRLRRADERRRRARRPVTPTANNAAVTGCAITGGAFYAPATMMFPGDYLNDYFFADFCAGWIRRLDTSNNSVDRLRDRYQRARRPQGVARRRALLPGARIGSGLPRGLRRQPAAGHLDPSRQPLVSPGQTATFTVVASGSGRSPTSGSASRAATGSTSAPTAPATRSPIPSPPTTARASACASPTASATSSATRRCSPSPAIRRPPPRFCSPPPGCSTRAGRRLRSRAPAPTPKTAPRPASAFTWRVDFHHDAHSHPFLPATSGITGGTFVIGTTGAHRDQRVVSRVPDGDRQRRSHPHRAARHPPARGQPHPPHQSGRPAAAARRPAGDDAARVQQRGRRGADARRARPDGWDRGPRFPVVARRRRARPRDRDAAGDHHLHRVVPHRRGHRRRPARRRGSR